MIPSWKPKFSFENRHIGPSDAEVKEMLSTVNADSLSSLIKETIPENILQQNYLDIGDEISEQKYLNHIKEKAAKNKIFRNYIGQGYYGTFTPSVILRNIFENPGWYTQYTPYQAEISQGRLEALLNFQTMVSDLTGMPIANASLLDEGTAAAEAMIMFYNQVQKSKKTDHKNKFLVSDKCFSATKDIIITRAEPLDINVIFCDVTETELEDDVFGILIQYPDAEGAVQDYDTLTENIHNNGAFVAVAADLLSLAVLKEPASWGADVVLGTTQRFGVPMGFGGPHAAYFATNDKFTRQIPGRIIGVSQDRYENAALRMALQTREQHIRREKATSNICTAQALLAIMAGMYAVYHGPEGIRRIAENVHHKTSVLAMRLSDAGLVIKHKSFFDTLCVDMSGSVSEIALLKQRALEQNVNLFYDGNNVLISLDETSDISDLTILENVFVPETDIKNIQYNGEFTDNKSTIPSELKRESAYLEHPVFNSYHSETQMMRYLKSLENKDLSLTQSMIPLGSCTMKLNAATQLMPLSWKEFAHMHPFAPSDQATGYLEIFNELEKDLAQITGLDACSLQPNSGAQGEYAGLLVIRAYHIDKGEGHRNVCIIPSSAHGTNPASAVMAGMKVVIVASDKFGNVDLDDLIAKAEEHKDKLSALMITYPSTHGVFEHKIKEIIEAIHSNGGLVYMDGANMNAQVGLTNPGICGADVVHLNLHKTFAIPHGGGGPGMGPICVNEKLKPYLPGHPNVKTGGSKAIHAVSAAPWGSASILLISYAYIKMLGSKGLKRASEIAILNANYIKAKLDGAYDILYKGKENGRVAHELIVDLRPFKQSADIDAEDVAKRMIDYSFHAPTMSWPVAGTIMIEPTESEDKKELDRFIDAMLSIRNEIAQIEKGEVDKTENVLHNSPHTSLEIMSDEWTHPYTRKDAAFPLDSLKTQKFWATVGRVNNSYGDRNLVCTCPPLEAYMEEPEVSETSLEEGA